MTGLRVLLVVSSAAALCALSCGSSNDDGSTPSVFLAFASDFQDYHAWKSFTLPQETSIDGIATPGRRVVYLNHVPPPGSHEFPVGTIVVKDLDADHPYDYPAFAMVKRGGGFNTGGAVDWEWFEVHVVDASGEVAINWRGLGPPVAETYGGDPNACNSCHENARGDDYVLSPPLQLTALQ